MILSEPAESGVLWQPVVTSICKNFKTATHFPQVGKENDANKFRDKVPLDRTVANYSRWLV